MHIILRRFPHTTHQQETAGRTGPPLRHAAVLLAVRARGGRARARPRRHQGARRAPDAAAHDATSRMKVPKGKPFDCTVPAHKRPCGLHWWVFAIATVTDETYVRVGAQAAPSANADRNVVDRNVVGRNVDQNVGGLSQTMGAFAPTRSVAMYLHLLR